MEHILYRLPTASSVAQVRYYCYMTRQFFIVIGVVALFLMTLTALFFWGPLRTLLPVSIETRINAVVPDYFAVGRAGIAPPAPGTLPPGSDAPTGVSVWTVTGRDGTVIQVTPFQGRNVVSGTSTPPSGVSGTPSEPSQLPSTDVVLSQYDADDRAYAITYFAHDQSFTLTLLKEPIGESRKAGEVELMSILGIRETEACRLRHSVLTPWWVNERYSGYNLDFSFCKGAPQF